MDRQVKDVAMYERLIAKTREMRNLQFDVRESVHHSTILTVKHSTRCKSVIKILLFIILNEAQHVSGDTPPIIRSLKLHKQPLVLHNTV